MRRLALGLLWVLASCKHPVVLPAGTLPPLPPPPADQVVAVVDGQPIGAAQVAEQARAAGTSPKEALDALIRGELLAQEAARRGLVSDPAVHVAAEQETVRAYLKNTFEKDVTPYNAVPEERLQRAYERNKPRLVHPDVRILNQLLIRPSEGNEGAQVEALAREVQAAAAATRSEVEFGALVDKYAQKFSMLHSSITLQSGPSSRHGMTIEEFAKAAFELKAIGDISPVVKTRFGYHIIRYAMLIPAENVSFEHAKEKLRTGLWPEMQTAAFNELMERLTKEHTSATFPARLAVLQEAEENHQ